MDKYSGCGCCGGVTRCVGGCGWWIEATDYTDSCLGDFVIEFELTGTETGSKNGATQRTSNPAVFIVPTDNGDYTITYETSPTRRWHVVGTGVDGYINYPFGNNDCDLAGTFVIGTVTIDFEVVAEKCPGCCGVDGLDDYRCNYRASAITNFREVWCDSGSVFKTVTQNGPSFWKYQADPNCRFTIPVISDEDPPITGEEVLIKDPATGSWNLVIGAGSVISFPHVGPIPGCSQSFSVIDGDCADNNQGRRLSIDFDVTGIDNCVDPIPDTGCAEPAMAMAAMASTDAATTDKPLVRHKGNLPMLSVCRECEHWGNRSETGCGSTGCLLSPTKPCDIGYHLRKGRGCFDLANPRFVPVHLPDQMTFRQSSMDDHCIAVTSLSLLPHHRRRQSICLDSWRRFGLSIIAVNRTCDIGELQEAYPQVSRWIANDTPNDHYTWHTQRINHLADVATEIGNTVLLINSDIELYGDQRKIITPLAEGKQVVGIRWNYDRDKIDAAKREQWGLDAFSFTPELAASLPRMDLAIGRPIWDYWIPIHSRTERQEMEFVGERLFYHQRHGVHWSKDDWTQGAEWVTSIYGTELHNGGVPFRKSLPFPPR